MRAVLKALELGYIYCLMSRFLFMIALAFAIAACNSAPPPPPFKPVADMKQLMTSVIEPAADEYWDAVGTIVDSEGVHEITPQTQEEWDATRNHAYVVTEAGNLLMMPTRAKDNGDWMKFSQALIDSGLKAARAAEARDREAVFSAGAEVYDACTQCHAKYALELQQRNLRQ